MATALACLAGATLTWSEANHNRWLHQSRRPVGRQTRDTSREVLTDHQHRAKQERSRTKALRRVERARTYRLAACWEPEAGRASEEQWPEQPRSLDDDATTTAPSDAQSDEHGCHTRSRARQGAGTSACPSREEEVKLTVTASWSTMRTAQEEHEQAVVKRDGQLASRSSSETRTSSPLQTSTIRVIEDKKNGKSGPTGGEREERTCSR